MTGVCRSGVIVRPDSTTTVEKATPSLPNPSCGLFYHNGRFAP